MVSQIVVSVTAAVCVGFITNAYFEQKPAPAAIEASVQAAEPTAATSTVSEPSQIVVGTADEAYTDVAPARPLAPVAAPSPLRNVELNPMPRAAPVVETPAASLPELPSVIIADLPVHDSASAANGAEIFPGVPSEDALAEMLREPAAAAPTETKRRHFLGLPLPYFMPTAGDIVQSAGSAGGKIVALVTR